MSRVPVPTRPSPPADPQITGTPRRPDMVRRRGLFVALLLAYLALLAFLIFLTLRQHHLIG